MDREQREGLRKALARAGGAQFARAMLWTNAQTIETWIAAHNEKGLPEPGAILELPDNGQRFIWRGKRFWNRTQLAGQRKPKPRVSYMWQSHCALCGTRYEFHKYDFARNLLRTCEAHRGQWFSVKPAAARRRRNPSPIAALINDAIRRMPNADPETIVSVCAASMPRGKSPRDNRKANVRAAWRRLDPSAVPAIRSPDALRTLLGARLEALELLGAGEVPRAAFEAHCATSLPVPAGRDTRLARVRRALAQMAESDALPDQIALTDSAVLVF